MKLEDAQREFSADHCYLNTATVGLGPVAAAEALTSDLSRWASGRIDMYSYDEMIDRSRAAYASLVGARSVDSVAIINQVSTVTGMVAAALNPGDEVLVADDEFTSIVFPFLARERDGIVVRTVPLDTIVDEIRDSTTLVAVAAAQSVNGVVTDLDALATAADAAGALTFVDLTQAAGWLPIGADRFTVTAASAYKWLCCPRGAGLMTIQPHMMDWLQPNASNWYATEGRWDASYGAPLRMASSARRYDISPAWSAWVGAMPALELLAEVGVEAIHRHNVALANSFRACVGLEPSNSAIVSFDFDGAQERLAGAGVSWSAPQGRTRLSFHLYNTEANVEVAAVALGV